MSQYCLHVCACVSYSRRTVSNTVFHAITHETLGIRGRPTESVGGAQYSLKTYKRRLVLRVKLCFEFSVSGRDDPLSVNTIYAHCYVRISNRTVGRAHPKRACSRRQISELSAAYSFEYSGVLSSCKAVKTRVQLLEHRWLVWYKLRASDGNLSDITQQYRHVMGAPTTLTVTGIVFLLMGIFVGWFAFPKMIHKKILEVSHCRCVLTNSGVVRRYNNEIFLIIFSSDFHDSRGQSTYIRYFIIWNSHFI